MSSPPPPQDAPGAAPRARRGVPRLGTRTAVALVALAVVGWAVQAHEWTRAALGAALAAAGTDEFQTAAARAMHPSRAGLGPARRAAHAALGASMVLAALWGGAGALGAAMACAAAAVLLRAMAAAALGDAPPSRDALAGACAEVCGHATVGYLLAHAALVLRGPSGTAGLFFVLAATVAGENAALFAGVALGGPRPLARLSPNKTLAGFLAQPLAAAAAAAAFAPVTGSAWPAADGAPPPPAPRMAALGLALGVAGVLGDLAESFVKRCVGVKDLGRVLPATGGVLDRIDGLLWAYPAAHYLSPLVLAAAAAAPSAP